MKRNLPLLIIGTVLLAALIGGGILYNRSKPAPTADAQKPQAANSAPGADPPRLRGNANAPVMLEEFGDFQCPPCGLLHPELKEIEKQYGDKLVVSFRQFPLAQLHKHAYDAARAAEAAGLQGKFWEMHDMLYEKQKEWEFAVDGRTVFTDYARTLGLDVERFSRDIGGDVATGRVTLDMRRGKSMGVMGTPTVFINGKLVGEKDMTRAGLTMLIDAALKAKGQ
ncbi:MAG: thioredoxin domain-containing protein [Pyrinomonadaceae bacterium]|nr:thioredoxin domain-containing protein [Pyrinomonadaceae bacterium]